MSDEDTSLRDAHNEGVDFELSKPGPIKEIATRIDNFVSMTTEEEGQFELGREFVKKQRDD